jgi:hypothetical protein
VDCGARRVCRLNFGEDTTVKHNQETVCGSLGLRHSCEGEAAGMQAAPWIGTTLLGTSGV